MTTLCLRLTAFALGLGGRIGRVRFTSSVAAAAVLLCLPALWVGLQLDDHYHRWILEGCPGLPGLTLPRLDLFHLTSDGARTSKLIEIGVLPWWTDPELRLAGFRPVAALTHLLDNVAWGERPVLMHLHSLLWLGLLVAVVARLYRRFLAGAAATAGLAAILYGLDDAHGFVAGWVANRNALIGACLGAAALIAHDRWRRGHRAAGALSPLLVGLALMACEAAVGVLAYFAAYAAVLEGGPVWRRVRSLVPVGLVAVLWWVGYRVAGYGAWGTDFYVDPSRDPLGFLDALVRRAPVLLAAQWTLIPADLHVLLAIRWRVLHSVVALLCLAPLAAAVLSLLRSDRTARFFAAGMVGALVPAVATIPMDRLLLFVGIGAMGLAAQLIAGLAEAARRERGSLVRRTVFCLLVITHVVLAPLLLPLRAASPRALALVGAGIDSAPVDANITGQDLVVVRAPDPFAAGLVPIVRGTLGQPQPRRLRLLASTREDLELRRTDARTLVVRGGGGVTWHDVIFVRNDARPLRVGDRIEIPGLVATVTEADDNGHIIAASFLFPGPLEDPTLRWVVWQDGALVPFRPPGVGETVLLPAPGLGAGR